MSASPTPSEPLCVCGHPRSRHQRRASAQLARLLGSSSFCNFVTSYPGSHIEHCLCAQFQEKKR